MSDFQFFLDRIPVLDNRERMENILKYIEEKFPQLKAEIKWNQPMFTDHGTYIIGFSVAKGHISVGPEALALQIFDKEIEQAGYSRTKGMFKIKWTDQVDFDLLDKMIAYNIEHKKNVTKFWG